MKCLTCGNHITGGNMDQMRGRAEAGAKRGYLTASIDCCYHGRRCPPGEDRRDCYEHALVRSDSTHSLFLSCSQRGRTADSPENHDLWY